MKHLPALLLLLFLMSCQKNKEVTIPDHVLGKEAFAKVLADFALAESASSMNIKDAPVFKMDSVYAFDPLKENHVTRAQYDSSIAFYAAHSELYKEVYETTLNLLSAMQTHHDSLKTHAQKVDTGNVQITKPASTHQPAK